MKHKASIEAFAKHLVKLRKQRNLTQEELANDAEIGIATLQRLEYGMQNPSLDIIISLANALQVHPKFMLDFFDKIEKA